MPLNTFKELKLHFEVLYSLSLGEGRGEVKQQTILKTMKKTFFKKITNYENI